MAQFKDSQGRVWDVELNLGQAMRLKAQVGVSVTDLYRDGLKPLAALLLDWLKFVDVLYVLCAKQAEERQLSQEDFAGGLGGDTLADAADAFVEAFCFFCPNPKAREALRAMVAKNKAITAKMLTAVQAEIEGVNLEEAAAQGLSILRSSAGSAAASSASTPAPSP